MRCSAKHIFPPLVIVEKTMNPCACVVGGGALWGGAASDDIVSTIVICDRSNAFACVYNVTANHLVLS